MAYLSQLNVNNSDYDLKDTEARNDLRSTQTATGNPITITDAAPINAESLVVELEPKQDLHGQDAPYVGGAGKNKLPLDLTKIKSSNTVGNWSGNAYYIYGVTFTVNTDDGGNVTGINIDGTLTSDYVDFLLDGDTRKPLNEWGLSIGTTYILSGNRDGAHVIYNGIVANITSGTFTADTSDSYFPCIRITQITYNNVLIQPMVCLASAPNPTAFERWSNICPITGYTECEVDDVGDNLFDKASVTENALEKEDGSGTTYYNGYYTSDYMLVEPSTDYYLQNVARGVAWYCAFFFDNSKTFLSKLSISSSGEVASGKVTTPSNCKYLIICGKTSYIDVAQVTKGETAPTEYHPYQSRTASVTFGQTVYGGKSNFTDGGTDSEFASVDLGDLSWTYRGDGLFSADLSDYAFESDVMAYCSGYRYIGTVDGASMATSNGSVYLYYNDGQSSRVIYVVDTQYADAIVFKAAVTGIQFVYEKATPTTIATPPTDLKLLKGTNNITTNGTTINLGYQPDNVIGEVKGEIEAITEMDYLKILDNNVETPINNYRIYYHLISGAYTLVNMGEMLQHRFIFVEVIKNPSGGVNKKVLHSALIDPRTIDGYEYEMKASGNDTIWIESILDENKFNLSLRTTGGSYTDGDPTDYYVTIRFVD